MHGLELGHVGPLCRAPLTPRSLDGPPCCCIVPVPARPSMPPSHLILPRRKKRRSHAIVYSHGMRALAQQEGEIRRGEAPGQATGRAMIIRGLQLVSRLAILSPRDHRQLIVLMNDCQTSGDGGAILLDSPTVLFCIGWDTMVRDEAARAFAVALHRNMLLVLSHAHARRS